MWRLSGVAASVGMTQENKADVAELVKIGDVDQMVPQIHESPHFRAGLGKRAGLTPCDSVAIFDQLDALVNKTRAGKFSGIGHCLVRFRSW